ncbi:MAG TPA: PP2C family protein-serine/threonine phosphatase, partial [Roseiarcus sp.]|nr:PP2C family protein-serine/threonine phosphatase [Roseiarcus sp.]
VPAALFMGITKTLIRINLRENPDLPGAIVKANAFLGDNNAGQLFATVLYAAYDPRSGALEYCNCGHLPGLIRRPGGVVETLPVGGLPVGLFEPMKMTVHRAELRPGDLFFLYTDGVTEAEDPDALLFGEDRLEGLLAKKGHGASASQWTARIEAAVREFARGRSQFDDITCLALRR